MTQGEDTKSQPTEGASPPTVADSQVESTAQSAAVTVEEPVVAADHAPETPPREDNTIEVPLQGRVSKDVAPDGGWTYFPPITQPVAKMVKGRREAYFDNLEQDFRMIEGHSLSALDQPIHAAYQNMWVADRNLLFTAMVRMKRKL